MSAEASLIWITESSAEHHGSIHSVPHVRARPVEHLRLRWTLQSAFQMNENYLSHLLLPLSSQLKNDYNKHIAVKLQEQSHSYRRQESYKEDADMDTPLPPR